jgi:thioredoxin-related protein
MKRLTGLLLVCLLASGVQAQSWAKKETVAAKTKGFMDDFAAAQKEAFKQPIFIFFTGSDWCGWCMKLRGEVLDTKEFEKFAATNLILLEADFPKAKKLSAAVKKQNEELASKYGVRGYPTVYLVDETGKVLAQTGYQAGGAEAYVKHLTELLEKAGVKVADGAAGGKPLSAYERMKAEKTAKATDSGAAKAR